MALDFNGSNEALLVGSGAGVPITAVPLTMACWINPDALAGSMGVMSLARNNNSALNYFELAVSSDGTVRALTKEASTSGEAVSAAGLSINNWHHIGMVTASSTSRYAYLNGVPGSHEETDKTPASISNAAIGSRMDSGPSRYFNGQIAECGWWNAALTTAEMAALAAGVSPLMIRPASLVAYHPLDLVATQRLDRTSTGFNLPDGNAGDATALAPPLLKPTAQILQFPTAAAPGGATPKNPFGWPLKGPLVGPM